MQKNNVIECKNCMKIGHIMKNCREPITSYGLILRIDDKYLMAQRKHSLGLLEFFAGRYHESDKDFIKVLLKQMSRKEFDMISKSTCFDDIVDYFGLERDKYCKSTYYGFVAYHNIMYCLKDICREINVSLLPTENEWGFPKGRRNFNETEIECAQREFCEETGIDSTKYSYEPLTQFSELFFGTNGKLYKHTYFLASSIISAEEITSSFKDGSFEIAEIGFFNKMECIEKMSLVIQNKRRYDFFNELLN